jgi:hypothetical protein
MNTVDWNTAPHWANYQARDKNGDVYWYESEPKLGKYQWDDSLADAGLWTCILLAKHDQQSHESTWEQSLQKRPTVDL